MYLIHERILLFFAILTLVFGIQNVGYAEVGTPICDRTLQVRDAIVAIAQSEDADVADCNDVTETHLYEVTTFSFHNKGVTTLKNGDFLDMPRLLLITLSSNDLTSLPADVFKGLPKFETLSLSHNELTSIPDDVFKGVTKLKRIMLAGNELSSLDEDVFDGLSLLQVLALDGNNFTSLHEDLFDGLSSLQFLFLHDNDLTSVSEDLFDGLSSLEILSLYSNDLTSLPEDLFDGLTKLRILYLQGLGLTSVPGDLFDGLASLQRLDLKQNQLTSLPDGLFEGLTKLEGLNLSFNPGPLNFTVLLEKVADGEFRARVPAGAPFEIVLPVSATNGAIDGGATTITIAKGSVESSSLTVTRTAGTTAAVTVDIGDTLPSLPSGHSGYQLVKSADMPLTVIPTTENRAPTFSATTATRSIAENAATGTNIGAAVSATDLDEGDTLTYSLVNLPDSTDADAFDIGGTDGQLKTKSALDYEARNSYRFKVQVSDGSDTASIEVTVTVTNVDETPQEQESDVQTTDEEQTPQEQESESQTTEDEEEEEEAGETDTDALTAGFVGMPASHDGSTAFHFELRFSQNVKMGFATMQDHVLTVTGGAVTGASRLQPGSNERWKIVVGPSSDADVTVSLAATTDCTVQGAVCTTDGKKLSNAPSATIAGPQPQEQAPANTPATGAPTIGGTAQVGQTLSASTSGISDANGLNDATFTYQWIRGNTDIAGATGSTYDLVDADQGKTIKVRVGFTDDDGHTESLTSAATDAVAARPPPLTASFSGVPAEHDGNPFSFTLTFSEEPKVSFRALKNEALSARGGTVTQSKRRQSGSNLSWTVTVAPSGHGDVGVTLTGSGACSGAGAVCTADGRKLSNAPSATVPGPPALSVADARANEGAGATVAFTVSLSRAPSSSVTVDYATADVTASAGSDYTNTSGTLTFAAGETSKTVSVPVLDDGHDEGQETFSLTLSNVSGARIADASATGTIVNSDPMPQAWLSRFGRTGAMQVLTLLDERFEAAPGAGNHLTLGGRAVPWPFGRSEEAGGAGRRPQPAPAEALGDTVAGQASGQGGHPGATGPARPATRLDDPAGTYGQPVTGPGNALQGAEEELSPVRPAREATVLERALWTLLTQRGRVQFDKRQFLSQSGFHLALGAEPGAAGADAGTELIVSPASNKGHWSLWGRGAMTHFSGRDDGVDLSGDVLTGLMGVDYAKDRWLAGMALAYHDGRGSYESPRPGAGGDLDSTLVTVNPYLRYALSPRLSAWGTLGYGTGTLHLRPDHDNAPHEVIETGMNMGMGAAGLRGIVYAGAATEWALKSDVMWVRTSSAAAPGLQRAGADTGRLRLLLSGQHRRVLANDAQLSPNVELGLRYDGGDAETGFGMELGGGLRYADTRLGLTLETKARALVAHEDGGYGEWGLSGSAALDPGRLGRGLALRLDSGWGIADSGAEALWQRQSAAGMAPQHGPPARGRLSVDVGYGLDVPWTYGILTPYGGMEWAGQRRTLKLGWRFDLGQALSLSLDGERHKEGHAAPEHALMLRTNLPW